MSSQGAQEFGKGPDEMNRPWKPVTRRRYDGMAVVCLNALSPAGRSAGIIAQALREEQVRV